MNESVFSSGVRGAIPYASPDPEVDIVLIPGLHGTVWLQYAAGSVHLDHEALRDLLFLRNTAALSHVGGTVILSPSGQAGIAIRLPSGLIYSVPRPALAAAAQGLTSSRYQPTMV